MGVSTYLAECDLFVMQRKTQPLLTGFLYPSL